MEPYFKFQEQSVIAAAHGGGPWDPSMLHGGAPTALITRLVEDIPTKVPMRLTRLTIDLKRPVPVGQIDFDVTVTREGRNIQTAELILTANGKEVVRASALRIRKTELDLPSDAALPATGLNPPSALPPFMRTEGFNSGVRAGPAEASPPGAANAVWFRIERPFFDDVPTTPLMRAAATGDYCNGFGCPLDFEAWTYINADLSLHFTRDPVGEWMMLAANSWIGPDGNGLAYGELSDTQGTFGRAVQSLVIAKR